MEKLDNNKKKVARWAGGLFLLCLLIPTLNWGLVLSPFQSIENIIEKEFLFRFNIVNQLITAIGIFLLGFYLHKLTKEYSENIAGLAYGFKIFEALIFVVLALLYLVIISLLKADLIEIAILHELIANYIPYTAIPGFFSGISMLLFSILFYNSNIILKWLAMLGIASSILVIIYDGSVILNTNIGLLGQIVGTGPVGLFQITIGFYLILNKHK